MQTRKQLRLQNYDYSCPGGYFITLCTKDMYPLFGEIIGEQMVLNVYGEIVKEEWLNTQNVRKNIILDEFVIMPNHFHAIIIINRTGDPVGRPHENIYDKATHRVTPT